MDHTDSIKLGQAVNEAAMVAGLQGRLQQIRITIDGNEYAVSVEEIKNPIKRIGCKAESAIGWTYCESCPFRDNLDRCREWRTKNRAEAEVGI